MLRKGAVILEQLLPDTLVLPFVAKIRKSSANRREHMDFLIENGEDYCSKAVGIVGIRWR